MFDPDDIDDLFKKTALEEQRWLFTPNYDSQVKGYRYALTFLPRDRRFTLARQKIVPFMGIEDDAMIRAFRSALTEDEAADCVRLSLKPQPDDDDIPF